MEDILRIWQLIFTALIFIVLVIIGCFLDSFTQTSPYHYDVNNDGKVDARDYVLIKNYIMSEGE